MRADKEHFKNLYQWNWMRFINKNCNIEREHGKSNILERLFKKKDFTYKV